MKEEKDDRLWQEAKARADFKTHFTTYIIINGLLWLIWLFSAGVDSHRGPYGQRWVGALAWCLIIYPFIDLRIPWKENMKS
jgi:hypothetical protein